MKKLFVVVLALAWPVIGYAAAPNSVGSIKASKILLGQKTLAQINSLTPDDTGQFVLCADCTQSAVCISSGANTPNSVGAFVILVNTGTFAGSTFGGFGHCK